MKILRYYLLLCVLLPLRAEAQSLAAVDSLFREAVAERKLAGAVALVAREGEIVHVCPYGYKDVETRLSMNRNALIPIASLTKVFTSIGIMILHEEGWLDIDDPVEKYLPEFRSLKVYRTGSRETEELTVKPTIRHLLSHTAGFVYQSEAYAAAGFGDWNRSLPEFVERITSIPLAFQPGTAWKYGYSHDILGYLIEQVSGVSIDVFLKERVFLPLGMQDTDFYVPRSKGDQESSLYIYEGDSLRKTDFRHNSVYHSLPPALSGGGGWSDSYGGVVSTVDDFYRLADWLLHCDRPEPAILGPAGVKAMITSQTEGLMGGRSYVYGLGVGITPDEAGATREIFWAGSPYNTYFWIDYLEREIGILFTNTAPYGHLDIMNRFKEAVSAAN